jgi:hypothetical protein
LELNLKSFHLNLLGIPQDRIAKRLGIPRKTLFNHLAKMPAMAKWPNSDLSKGFSVPQVAQKHGWPEPVVWSQALNKRDDQTYHPQFLPGLPLLRTPYLNMNQ